MVIIFKLVNYFELF